MSAQIQVRLRGAIRAGALRSGVKLPSTRSLAGQLGVSRPLVVEAYAQLAAEGYLELRRGACPVVAGFAAPPRQASRAPAEEETPIRFDLRPAIPDLGMFPRQAWLRAVRAALNGMTAEELGYGDRHGAVRLRNVIADYLGRTRGVLADPDLVVVTGGFAEGRALFCHALRARGIERLGVEDPSYSDWEGVDMAGLHRIPIAVDSAGIDIAAAETSAAQALFVTPAHQFPIGAVLGAERRSRLVSWLRDRDGFALEDDYDAEFRYDQSPVGALQGLAPDRIVYAGTVSKTLAPGLRLGWLVVPPDLADPVRAIQRRWNAGPPRIDQAALAAFMESGAYDRHLRRMRRVYRRRRDTLMALLADKLPEARFEGVAAGLHITLRLPDGADELGICTELRRRGVAVEGLSRYSIRPYGSAALLLGYGRASESGLRASVQALAEVVSSQGEQDRGTARTAPARRRAPPDQGRAPHADE
ncbi:PLP-dependent aminotransferase family protein [Sphingosinicella sp. CPCC 101087]|uniref:MocR-like pyridoxine biosynthesis transcription factor PdxR n=1 Tax=Sphingosinicella sp. CPCC 101087 TaxID=2497754 RepID=UPI00198218B8|nr:PLP-dependent aminotransferase family protein [Sphingosinicella sp. CPCC 101087]